MNQEEIGKFILKLRSEKNMTQEELAKKLNVTDRAISHWENGRRLPDIFLLKSICDVFDISIEELISCKKIKNINERSDDNLMKMIDYSNSILREKNKIIYITLLVLGLFIVLFSFLFMNSKDNVPMIFISIGICILTFSFNKLFLKKHKIIFSILIYVGIFLVCFTIDYLSVVYMRKVPIFKYRTNNQYMYKEYDSFFYKAYQVNAGEGDLEYFIIDTNNKYNEDTLPVSVFNRDKNGWKEAILNSKKLNNVSDFGKPQFFDYTYFLPLSDCSREISLNDQSKITFFCDDLHFVNNASKYREAFLYSSLLLFLTRDDINKITFERFSERFVAYREYFEENYPNYNEIDEDNFNQLVERKMFNTYFVNKTFDKVFVGEYKGENFIRTYKVLNVENGLAPDSYYLTLNQCEGEMATVFVRELEEVPEEGKYYEFSMQPKVSTNYIEDTIESIFNNSRVTNIVETDKVCEEQIQDKINRYDIYK